jgi:molecular chaperone DnaK
MEKMLKEHGDKLTEADKGPILSALEKVRDKAKGDDAAAIKQAIAELEQASHAMAQHLYKQAGTRGGPGEGPTTDGAKAAGGKDDVIDAEFEVKK